MIFNAIFDTIALHLTNFENPRTETDYDNLLSSKLFVFQFVNNFFTLFYIAFW